MTTSAQLAKLKTRLASYEAALESALTAESYTVAGRSKAMAKVSELQKIIDSLEARIARLEQNGNAAAVYTPVFIPRDNLGAEDDEE